MKQTAIKIDEKLLQKINTLKYQLGLKTQEEVLNRLIDLATPPNYTADNLPPKEPISEELRKKVFERDNYRRKNEN